MNGTLCRNSKLQTRSSSRRRAGALWRAAGEAPNSRLQNPACECSGGTIAKPVNYRLRGLASIYRLKFGAWCFYGAWSLVFGAFLEFGVWSLEFSPA
jgi:hypothetical protein